MVGLERRRRGTLWVAESGSRVLRLLRILEAKDLVTRDRVLAAEQTTKSPLGLFVCSAEEAELPARTRMAERYFASTQNREPVPRQIFVTTKI